MLGKTRESLEREEGQAEQVEAAPESLGCPTTGLGLYLGAVGNMTLVSYFRKIALAAV